MIGVVSADGMPREKVPRRVRVTTRKTPDVAAGDYIELKARLLPPSPAALPGGYDFARDAYFRRRRRGGLDAGPDQAPPAARRRDSRPAFLRRDRSRPQPPCAQRVNAIIGGDEGAIAAAMVTGKRDFLSNNAKDLIREAGIFHIITISGVQMTLVAGIFFVVTRRLFALSPTLALNYPIKKWAALVAMAGSVFYDIATGSRVGTERALVMTLIVLVAVMIDRRALTMRNLAFAVLAVVALEPEAILGVSFQLSFAAVAALIAVMEARLAQPRQRSRSVRAEAARRRSAAFLAAHLVEKPRALLFATACATSATASFMAYHFHDLSPYVLIGNPLTLSIIEFFAVPGALLGAALYPLGLDAPVWHYVGVGIKFILWVARFIAEAPGSTLHLRAFAPYALPFLALAVISATIWRTWTFRAHRDSVCARRSHRRVARAALRRDRPAVGRRGGGARRRRRAQSWASASTPSPPSNGSPPTATSATRRKRPTPKRLRPSRLRRRFARRRVAVDRPRSHRVLRGLRPRRGFGERSHRASRVQGEIRPRRKGARALGRHGHDL